MAEEFLGDCRRAEVRECAMISPPVTRHTPSGAGTRPMRGLYVLSLCLICRRRHARIPEGVASR